MKEACPVESSHVTMGAAVHLPQEEHDAPVCLVLVALSVSIAPMKAAPPSPATTEGYAQKRPASRSSTASVPVVGQVNGASRAVEPLSSPLPCALLQTATAKPMMAFATKSATFSLVAGMAVTALLLLTLGLVVLTLAAGGSSTTASVMSPVTMLTVSMITLTARARKKSASEFLSIFFYVFYTKKSSKTEANLSVCAIFSPIYETYCIDHYADGRCDQGCNSEECGWDGLDCAKNVPEDLADGSLVLVVLMPPEELLRTSTTFLQKLSAILHTSLRFRLDRNGEAMIRPYTRREARLKKRELQPQQEVIGSVKYSRNTPIEVFPACFK